MSAREDLISRLMSAARAKVPLVVVRRDGVRVAGAIHEVGITFVILRQSKAETRRLDLADIFEVLRVDGRPFWKRSEARAS